MEDSGIESDIRHLHPLEGSPFQGCASDSSCSSGNEHDLSKPKSSGQHFQRRLDQRIEKAKKLQKYEQQDQRRLQTGSSLIPIQRLSIPSKTMPVLNKENVPLVDWDTDDSEEDIHFFPIPKAKDNYKNCLKDTFSLEEYDISVDEDDLNLLPPKSVTHKTLCCFTFDSRCSII